MIELGGSGMALRLRCCYCLHQWLLWIGSGIESPRARSWVVLEKLFWVRRYPLETKAVLGTSCREILDYSFGSRLPCGHCGLLKICWLTAGERCRYSTWFSVRGFYASVYFVTRRIIITPTTVFVACCVFPFYFVFPPE